ncbi:MAG: hypothetical protein GQ574_05395 [Crocinitomix sp.]|nr:hypothetical protein [Crocinitomix sp.]
MKAIFNIIALFAATLFINNAAHAQLELKAQSKLEGYTEICNENETKGFLVPTDVAYGINGKYKHKYRVTAPVKFNNQTFGDPAPGVAKKGYAKPYKLAVKEGESKSFNVPVVAAYGINGEFFYKVGVFGMVHFNNNYFGDPAPGQQKKGYYKPFKKVAKEGSTYKITGRADVAYGANGKYIIKRNVTGNVQFTNSTFGDPTPGVVKAGYINQL